MHHKSKKTLVKCFIILTFLWGSSSSISTTGHYIVKVDLSEYTNWNDSGSNGNRCEGGSWFPATSDCDPFFKVTFYLSGVSPVIKESIDWRNKRVIRGTFFTAQYRFQITMPPKLRQMSVLVEAYDHDSHSAHDHLIDKTFYFNINSQVNIFEKIQNRHTRMFVRIVTICENGYFGHFCAEKILPTTTSTRKATTITPTTTSTTRTTITTSTKRAAPTTTSTTRAAPTTTSTTRTTPIPTTRTTRPTTSTATEAIITSTIYYHLKIATTALTTTNNSTSLAFKASNGNVIEASTSRILLITCALLFLLVFTLIGILAIIFIRSRKRNSLRKRSSKPTNGCVTVIYRSDEQQWPVEESRIYGVNNETYTMFDEKIREAKLEHLDLRRDSGIYETID